MGAGKHGGMGNTEGATKTIGNSPEVHKPSIDNNVKTMEKDYPYTKSGYFGKRGKNSRIINTDTPEATSIDFFNRISKNSHIDQLPNGKGIRATFPDGTVITHRLTTKTPNSPAVDINISHSKLIKSQKIHFIKDGD